MARIRPRTLKGFRDFLPALEIARERMIATATGVYRAYGFSPIDTPALEYSEILVGKGGEESDKQLYRFDDQGGRDVALRFDLTVPFARFAAQHIETLGTPFKRYHVGPVWRGENTQRGRYREFVQCDFDTIGTESTTADIETVLVIHDVFRALGFERFTIRVNNRRVLTGLLERLDLAEQSVAVLRALDKLPKIGPDRVVEELVSGAGAGPAQAAAVIRLADLDGDPAATLDRLDGLVAGSALGARGVAELGDVVSGAAAGGVGAAHLQIDPAIARGLDYYTGTVVETFLDDLPGIGSVCSGGRYDDLASLYTGRRLPGIGASLGVDRLLAAMEELDMLERRVASAPVLLAFFVAARRDAYLAIAARLRAAGIAVEFYPEPRKLGAQLKYADRRGHRLAVIIGAEEWAAGTAQIKDLATGEARVADQDELAERLREALDR